MGFEEIYIVGCDCDYSDEKRYFDDFAKGFKSQIHDDEQKMIMMYQIVKKYAYDYCKKIYHATRDGRHEAFGQVNFDEII